MSRRSVMPLTALVALALAGCAGSGMSSSSPAAKAAAPTPAAMAALPEAVRVPPGHKLAMETVGVGDITYECREKTGAAGTWEWTFVGPQAVLNDRAGRAVGRYYGPPATWAASDGSMITGTQQAVAPAGGGNLPLQLVKANPAQGTGAMQGVSYVQRVATRGGVAPMLPCDDTQKGRREIVKYQADYLFWSPI